MGFLRMRWLLVVLLLLLAGFSGCGRGCGCGSGAEKYRMNRKAQEEIARQERRRILQHDRMEGHHQELDDLRDRFERDDEVPPQDHPPSR